MTAPVITTFNIGYMKADLDHWFKLPSDHPNSGQVVEIPMLCFHIAHADRSVMVDAPAYEFPGEDNQYEIPGKGGVPLLKQMEQAGINPDQVSDVIITHAHFDHYNGLSLPDGEGYRLAFPHAQHYLGLGDFNPEEFDDLDERTFGLLNERGKLFLVDQLIDIDDSMTIIPIPGETPGHQMLMLATLDGHAYFAGDLYHHPVEFGEPELNVYWAAEQMGVSKGSVAATALEHGASVYFTHIPGPHRVRLEGEKMVWEVKDANDN